MKINNTFSGIYFSFIFIGIENFIFTLLKINNKNKTYLLYCGTLILFFILGWFINIFLYKHYVDKIVNLIQKKYNQSNVIEKLKRDLEEEHELRYSNKSLETIGKNNEL